MWPTIRCAILLLALAATGCRGLPNRVANQREEANSDDPRGPEERGGRGYTRSFDPKAGKIELVPARRSNRVNREQVLVATVYDRDGNPRRRQRVEWMIEGPGNIVELDERGVWPSRGRKIDGKFGYSFTDNFSRTVTRTTNPRDDFEIQSGQTWCVVTSAIEGQTVVTAYAPDIFDSQTNKTVANLSWTGGDSRTEPARAEKTRSNDTLPPLPPPDAESPASLLLEPQMTLDVKLPTNVGANRELPITISLANNGRGASQPLTVSATIPDDVSFVRSEPAALRRSGSMIVWAIDELRGKSNRDLVLVVRPTKLGTITVGVLAESADGTRAAKRVTTEVETAGMKLKLEGETFASVGDSVPLQLTVTNTGKVSLENAVAWIEVPDGLSIEKQRANPAELSIGRIPANESRTIAIPVKGNRPGKYSVEMSVTGDGGLVERTQTNVSIGRAELEVTVTGADSIPVGQSSLVEFRVANRGDTTVRNVELQANVPRGLTADSATEGGRSTREGATWNIGTLPPGEVKTVRLNITGERVTDRGTLVATADAELVNGGRILAKKATAAVSVVGLPILMLELVDPSGPVAVGGRAVYRATIRNRGNTIARDVEVTAEWSNELLAIRGSGPNRVVASVGEKQFAFPKFDLAAGSSATFVLETEGKRPGTAHMIAQVKCQEVTTAVKEEQVTRILAR